MPLKLTEGQIKGQIKAYLAVRHIFNYHNLQALGSYKGLPDRTMQLNGKVVYLEIKKPGAELTPSELAFQEQCERDRVPYWVIRDVDELIKRLEEE